MKRIDINHVYRRTFKRSLKSKIILMNAAISVQQEVGFKYIRLMPLLRALPPAKINSVDPPAKKKKDKNTAFLSSQKHAYQNSLEELSKGVEEGGNTTDSNAGTVGDSGTGAGGRCGAASAGGSSGLAVGGGRVVGLGVTFEGTLDDGLANALEVGAVECAVSALQVEATLDIGQTSKVNARYELAMKKRKVSSTRQRRLTC